MLVLLLLLVALWFVLHGGLFCVLSCVILFFCFFSVLLTLRLPRLGKRELILVLFVRLFDSRLFGFCLFSLPLGVWEGLRFVIVAFPGLSLLPFLELDDMSLAWPAMVQLLIFIYSGTKPLILVFFFLSY